MVKEKGMQAVMVGVCVSVCDVCFVRHIVLAMLATVCCVCGCIHLDCTVGLALN